MDAVCMQKTAEQNSIDKTELCRLEKYFFGSRYKIVVYKRTKKVMREVGIKENLIVRIIGLYSETASRIDRKTRRLAEKDKLFR